MEGSPRGIFPGDLREWGRKKVVTAPDAARRRQPKQGAAGGQPAEYGPRANPPCHAARQPPKVRSSSLAKAISVSRPCRASHRRGEGPCCVSVGRRCRAASRATAGCPSGRRRGRCCRHGQPQPDQPPQPRRQPQVGLKPDLLAESLGDCSIVTGSAYHGCVSGAPESRESPWQGRTERCVG